MPRALWKAKIKIADRRIAVKLFAALDAHSVPLRMLHNKDLAPITQRLRDKQTGATYSYKDARRGLVLDNGEAVKLSESELASLEANSSRDIEIMGSLARQAVELIWLSRPYYLGAEDDAENSYRDYATLYEALRKEDCCLLAKWTMRKQYYHGLVFAGNDNQLLLYTLNTKDKVVQFPTVALCTDELSGKERQMALQLVESLAGEFSPEDYSDQYKKRLLNYLEAKAAGRIKRLPKLRRKKASTASILKQLEGSLKAVGNG